MLPGGSRAIGGSVGQLARSSCAGVESDSAKPVTGRFFQKLCVYGRDAAFLKVVCDIRRRTISHVPRFTPLFFAALVRLSSPAPPKDRQIRSPQELVEDLR
jgi:hypothetical protein